ncbi:MAG TPA: type II toxin-antitoxin system VapC family toxin [Terracidiphilus sp.]|jgi:ribonuclease VapC|nr:type II toxin-antitoxin system VapC family toxin [Terracidiphilus sp.]
MILDTSAIIAILKNEAEADVFSEAIEAAKTVRISAANYLETHLLVDRYRNPILNARLETIFENPGIQIEPVTVEQAKIARSAYRDYGKGSGHRANLNFGDCFSYALAREKREPILFKGDDFVHTDLRSALGS